MAARKKKGERVVVRMEGQGARRHPCALPKCNHNTVEIRMIRMLNEELAKEAR